MLSKLYGHTHVSVSAIGFGGMRFGATDDIGRCAALVRYAHARGINYFDTAPDYCDDRSEAIVGQGLAGLPRASYTVATKSAKSRGAELRTELERSLTRLRVDHIDFFHIWCLMSAEDWQNRLRGGAVDAARRAQEEGLIRHLVCSSHMHADRRHHIRSRYGALGVVRQLRRFRSGSARIGRRYCRFTAEQLAHGVPEHRRARRIGPVRL